MENLQSGDSAEVFSSQPIRRDDGIPVFSEVDFYVENYEQISSDHLKAFDHDGHNPFMREDHWQEVEKSTEDLISKYANASTRILDVGVGMGRLLERFPHLERHGMDISMGYLRHAHAKGIDVCMSRIEDMPYKAGQFDIVVTTDVLEHVLDLNLALKKILSVLKPGGVLIVRVPYREDLSGYVGDDCPYQLVHVRSFDKSFLQILLEKLFRLDTLELSLSGYIGGRFKYCPASFYLVNKPVRQLLKVCKIFGTRFHFMTARILNAPTEINWVVRKTGREPRV